MAETSMSDIALKRAMALCAGREMCRSEISHKLSSWGVSENDAGIIISKLVKEKFIDEERYSSAFVRDKFRYNKWGKVKISAALKMKNIPGEIISLALGSIDDETYLSALRDIISHQRRKVKAKNQYDLNGKLLRFGLSKGFESHLLYDLLNETE
ncbi:MAG: regulatory protein RecX [Bacteroidales bacterium]|jgi:regulatory protein